MQVIKLPDEIAEYENPGNRMYVFLNGILLTDSAYFNMKFVSDYDVLNEHEKSLVLNRKAKKNDLLQLICPCLQTKWVYRHDDSGWKLLMKLNFFG